ncbi:MAG: DUF6665 family protein [Nitriliruptorales bacterium]|nr:DUF6665 family protein [Nitriliruptorales bacterium]
MAQPPYAASHRTVRRGRAEGLANVERELLEERANALGRAGDRLDRALATYRSIDGRPDVPRDRVEAALTEVRDATYALLVQRDCIGFRMDNLAWIRRHYDIPDRALRRI